MQDGETVEDRFIFLLFFPIRFESLFVLELRRKISSAPSSILSALIKCPTLSNFLIAKKAPEPDWTPSGHGRRRRQAMPEVVPIFLPHFRLHEVVSLHMCVLPYKYRKRLKRLLKLMKLCFNNGFAGRAGVCAGSKRIPGRQSTERNTNTREKFRFVCCVHRCDLAAHAGCPWCAGRYR